MPDKSKKKDNHGGRKERVSSMIRRIESKLEGPDRVTVGDYIRLTSLEEELEEDEDRPGEVLARWEDIAPRSCE